MTRCEGCDRSSLNGAPWCGCDRALRYVVRFAGRSVPFGNAPLAMFAMERAAQAHGYAALEADGVQVAYESRGAKGGVRAS